MRVTTLNAAFCKRYVNLVGGASPYDLIFQYFDKILVDLVEEKSAVNLRHLYSCVFGGRDQPTILNHMLVCLVGGASPTI